MVKFSTTSELYALYQRFPSVQTDTRKIQPGAMYWALKGARFDGNTFAQQALNAGASAVVVDDENRVLNEQCYLVQDGLSALQALATMHRQQLNIPFLAITGSNGKTTTKELLHAVLRTKFRTYATEGNLNNHIGVPLTILKIGLDAELAIIEMGANHQQEIASYCTIALPTHALINNCGKAHLEGFGGEEGVRKGKGELYDFIRRAGGLVFRNADLNYLEEMSRGIPEQVTYGHAPADYFGISEMQDGFLKVHVLNPGCETSILTQLVGDYNFANVMGAVAMGRHFGIGMDTIRQALENYTPTNSRSQRMQSGSNTIILDAYNANPSSMQAAIQNFVQTSAGNKIVMLGAMMELGASSVAEHQALIQLLEQSNWNQVVLVGGDFKFCEHPYIYFETAKEAAVWYQELKAENTFFLIKGSRAIAMEQVLEKE